MVVAEPHRAERNVDRVLLTLLEAITPSENMSWIGNIEYPSEHNLLVLLLRQLLMVKRE